MLIPGAAVAQNLVTNPGFADLSGWTEWATFNPAGSGTVAVVSGSAQISRGAASDAEEAYGLSQCIDLSADQPVINAVFGGRFNPTTGTPDGSLNVSVEIALFSGLSCSGQLISAGSQGKTLGSGDIGMWQAIDYTTPSFFAISPLPSPLSAQIRVFVRAVTGTAPATTVLIDDVFFAVNGSISVELQSFQVE